MVVLRVLESATAGLLDQGLWYGGFAVEARADELCSTVTDRVLAIVEAQLKLLRILKKDSLQDGKESAKEYREAIGSAVKICFPIRLEGLRAPCVSVDGVLESVKKISKPELSEESCNDCEKITPNCQVEKTDEKPEDQAKGTGKLWLAKKAFFPNEKLLVRIGKNEKSKLNVYFTFGNADLESLKVNRDTLNELAEFLVPFSNTELGKRKSLGNTESVNASDDQAMLKSCRADLSFALIKSDKAAEEEEDLWKLPHDKLALLEGNEKLQAQLRDDRLVNILARIEQSEDRMKELNTALEQDTRFASFVDLILETIGAHKSVELPNGVRRIESCINELLRGSTSSLALEKGDDMSDSESDRE